MDKKRFQDLIKGRLGGRPVTDTSLDTIIDNEADNLQDSLEQSGRKFDFQEVENSESVVAGTVSPQIIALPTDYLGRGYNTSIRLYDSDDNLKVVLRRRPFDELSFHYNPATSTAPPGTPISYDMKNDNLYVFPFLDVTYTLKYFYLQSADKVSGLGGTVTNYWLTNAGDYFVAHVGIIIASQVIHDTDAVQLFNSQAILADKRLDVREAAFEQEDFEVGMELIR